MFSRKHEDFDEFCDPENPKTLRFVEIENAADRIKPYIRNTPLKPSKYQREFGIKLLYKLEFLQPSGSFKDRGTLNFFHRLSLDRQRVGVITSDTGNFAISLCHHAKLMKIPVTVVMPLNSAKEKVYKCIHMGATVITQGLNLMEAQKHARALARKSYTTYVNSRDHPYVLAGYGTLGMEIIKQCPGVDAILVPVGSGGLISAVATAVKHLKPECQVYEDFDEFCDPENPKTLRFVEIENAADRIKPYIRNTPLKPSKYQREFGIKLLYKLEFLQPSGSFKDRGTLNFFHRLSLDRQRVGVITSDTGNFAISLCHHAKLMKIPVTVVMPLNSAKEKVYKCIHMGATVITQGLNLMEAQKHARALARKSYTTYVNSRDHPYVLAGYGTLGMEIIKQCPGVDAILVPVGSGGLISAVATAVKHLKPECQVYGVEPEAMPTLFKSLEMGEPIVLPEGHTRAENVSVTHPGCNSFNMNKNLLDKMLLVNEEWISKAIMHLFDCEKYVVEGAGACPLAAIFGKVVPEFKKKTVVCLLTGGNIDMVVLIRAIEHCLGTTGRLIKFQVSIKNTSEGLRQLFDTIAKLDCSILHWERIGTYDRDHVHYARMKMLVETPSMDYYLDLKRIITMCYPESCLFELDNITERRACPCQIKKLMKKKHEPICKYLQKIQKKTKY